MLSVLREVHSNDEQTNKKVITIPYGGYGREVSLGVHGRGKASLDIDAWVEKQSEHESKKIGEWRGGGGEGNEICFWKRGHTRKSFGD